MLYLTMLQKVKKKNKNKTVWHDRNYLNFYQILLINGYINYLEIKKIIN